MLKTDMSASRAAPDSAVAVEILESLLRDDADPEQKEMWALALPPVLAGLRARCDALAGTEADGAPDCALGIQSLAEEVVLLASRLIRLAQQAPAHIGSAVAGEMFAAWAALRALATWRGRHTACLLLGFLANASVLQKLPEAPRRQVVVDALSRLRRASGASREDAGPGSNSAPPAAPSPLPAAASALPAHSESATPSELADELLMCSLNILTEELLNDAQTLEGAEPLATKAFEGTTLLLFAALEQCHAVTLLCPRAGAAAQPGSFRGDTGQAPQQEYARQWSEGVLQAAVELSVVCAHAQAQLQAARHSRCCAAVHVSGGRSE